MRVPHPAFRWRVGFSPVRQRTSLDKDPPRAKPTRARHPLHTNSLIPLVTLVFPPSRFLWHFPSPPRYTCSRGRDSCVCPQPHPLCGPRRVFENQGTRQTTRAPVRSSANPSQPAPKIPETKREINRDGGLTPLFLLLYLQGL